jgi:hypothetical protein
VTSSNRNSKKRAARKIDAPSVYNTDGAILVFQIMEAVKGGDPYR